MKKRILWIAWVFMYGVCAVLAHITHPQGAQLWAIPTVGALFFVPPAWLLVDALRSKDRKSLRILRWISGVSVVLTPATVILTVLTFQMGNTVGIILDEILIFISMPLKCMGNMYVSLFLWCCIFYTTFSLKNKKK